MWLLPRLRLVLARRPWLYWLVVGLCAGVLWLQWSSVQRAADHARHAWGEQRAVLVSLTDADPGEPLTVEVRHYPTAVVPFAALAELPDDVVAARDIAAGAVLVAADLVGSDTPPSDWVVVAVPAQDAPQFVGGQRAAVFASGAPRCDGIVTDASVDRVEVAMPPDCAVALTPDLLAGSVVLARRS